MKTRKPLAAWALAAALALGFVALGAVAADAAEPTELPLTGPAFRLAEEAYADYASGDYSAAAAKAREAARLRPDSQALRSLITNAEAAAKQPTAAPLPTQPALPTRLRPLPLETPATAAYRAAMAGYRAYEAKRFELAVTAARKAVVLEPQSRPHWLLLTHALAANSQPALALEASTVGIAEAGDDGSLAALATSLRQMLAAAAAAPTARPATELTTEPIASPVTDQSPPPLPSASGYAAAARGYDRYAAGDYTTAATLATAALQQSPENRDYQQLQIDALTRAGDAAAAEQAITRALASRGADAGLLAQRAALRRQQGEQHLAREDLAAARRLFDQNLDAGRLPTERPLETAYLASRVGNRQAALAAFQQADSSGALPATAAADAGYAALHAGHDAAALRYFRRRIDDAYSGAAPLEPQALFDLRRTVSEVERRGGVIASLAYRGAVSGLGQVPGTNTNSLQAGLEGYWRPWGFLDGRYGELFARGFSTLYSEDDAATGADSLQAALGARYKPWQNLNLIGSLSRVLSPQDGRNDWLAQLAYSGGRGSDLRVDTDTWTTLRLTAEVGRYLEEADSYALATLEAGQSRRLGGGSSRWILYPHVSLAADYDSTARQETSAGIGPGLGLRYWFREDRHRAPRATFDATLQYRFKLAGADRGDGVFFTTTLSY